MNIDVLYHRKHAVNFPIDSQVFLAKNSRISAPPITLVSGKFFRYICMFFGGGQIYPGKRMYERKVNVRVYGLVPKDKKVRNEQDLVEYGNTDVQH